MTHLLLQADARRLPLADASVDLVFCSPPYSTARTYGINAQRSCAEWVEWMLGVVKELTRVCSGLVLVNCAGVTRDRCYWPACEGLMWEWWKAGGNLWRPSYWHRVGIPGSGGKQWLRADIEYVIPFKRDAEWLPWADNTANGHPPKWGPGGEMSYRLADGGRTNSGDFKIRHTKSRADGTDAIQTYEPPDIANPGNLIQGIKVGGGLLGHPMAHENEAPFPEKLAAWFIRGWSPPGGWVLDPFSGSGTTVAAALELGRNAIGTDIRQSQCELARRRIANPMAKRKPKRIKISVEPMLFAMASPRREAGEGG